MNFQRILVPLIGIALIVAGYVNYGWPGVAAVTGGIVMYLLLSFTRALNVLRRAADRPVGSVASAVMLNAKLKPRMALLHVVAMTRALGELRTPKGDDPEVYRWTDSGGSFVDVQFRAGKLQSWTLTRPDAEASPAGADVMPPST